MLVGKYTGRKVAEAKPLIKEEMLAEGDALLYSEPERQVGASGGRVAGGAGLWAGLGRDGLWGLLWPWCVQMTGAGVRLQVWRAGPRLKRCAAALLPCHTARPF
jgi:hypothetical protein